LGPFLRCQIDGDEWTKTGLNVCKEEHKPVKCPATAK